MTYYFFNSNFEFLIQHIDKITGVWDNRPSTALIDFLPKVKGNYFIERCLYEQYAQFLKLDPIGVIEANLPASEKENTELFFLSNDTIARMFKNLLTSPKYKDKKNILVSRLKRENEINEIDKMGKSYYSFESHVNYAEFSRIVMGNDWGPEEKRIVDKFGAQGKYSFCLQESVIDFSGNSVRMRYCDIPMIQGINTLASLKRSFYALTGNPRYEDLTFAEFSAKRSIIVNSNFTYGVSEEFKETWLGDIISVLQSMNLDFKIARHPRDTKKDEYAEYSIQSNASVVHDILRDGSILITRFSSLIHEALALGRPVIYYNLMKEDFYYDFGFNDRFLFQATTKEELTTAIEVILSNFSLTDSGAEIDNYLRIHVGKDEIKPSIKIDAFFQQFSKVNDLSLQNHRSYYSYFRNLLIYYKRCALLA